MKIPTISDYSNKQIDTLELKGGLKVNGVTKTDVDSNQLLVTIITVVFNADKSLESTIKSVINQSYENIEYILIDGGSTDNTLDILRKYENDIDYWISEADNGIYDAMNKGISLSNGSLIGIINAGDMYKEEAIEIVVNYYEKEQLSSVYVGDCKLFINQNDQWILMSAKSRQFPYRMIPHPSTFISASIYKNYGLFDDSFKIAADYDLLCRLYKKSVPFVYINEVITIACPPGLSSNYYLANIEALKVRLRHRLPFISSISITILGFLKATVRTTIKYFLKKQII
ncbi:glycosyltransferase family 2 protein [Brunnivagina elsteri]|uniref:Glycosyl transferase n=1 Tax=Brunnivagina elsteri CCALA 953 TaxID=987040 RepID=A0A2A2TNH3_9CYAN|nr:glycosyltransferase family 2 protein [Calothrix elsteri]PAX60061.1 glycosyl transferase [Calothrix elsteri CCALA 953]